MKRIIYLGFLQPLLISKETCKYITMDFIERLPKTEWNDTIIVVVEKNHQVWTFHNSITFIYSSGSSSSFHRSFLQISWAANNYCDRYR
jgi:hypothetical protein